MALKIFFLNRQKQSEKGGCVGTQVLSLEVFIGVN